MPNQQTLMKREFFLRFYDGNMNNKTSEIRYFFCNIVHNKKKTNLILPLFLQLGTPHGIIHLEHTIKFNSDI